MVNPALAAAAATTAASFLAPTPPPAAAPKANDIIDQADFLRLLVAQLQNQDPLNPLDSANFSAQLAQFASLEQLTQINQRLAARDTAPGDAGRFDAVGFLGKEVRGASDAITVKDGTASTLDYELASAGTVQAKIFDAAGREVTSVVLGTVAAGPQRFDLAALADVPTLPDGVYSVRLTVGDAGGVATPIATTVAGRVTGVDLSTDPPVLLLGTQRLPLVNVREVREAAADAAA